MNRRNSFLLTLLLVISFSFLTALVFFGKVVFAAESCTWNGHHVCWGDVGCKPGASSCGAPACHCYPDGSEDGFYCGKVSDCSQHCGNCPGSGDNCCWLAYCDCACACSGCCLDDDDEPNKNNNLVGRVWDDETGKRRYWSRTSKCGHKDKSGKLHITQVRESRTETWRCNPQPYYRIKGKGGGWEEYILTPPAGWSCVGWSFVYAGSPPSGQKQSYWGSGCKTIPIKLKKGEWHNHLWWQISLPQATCSLSLSPDQTIIQGEEGSLSFNLDVQDGDHTNVTDVSVTSENESIATVESVALSEITSNPFNKILTVDGVGVGGPISINANVQLDSGNSCSDNAQITVDPPEAWFQTKEGDVYAAGVINDSIPATATEPYCSLEGDGGFPGVVAYGGSSAGFGDGSVSGIGWLANSAAKNYSYNFFANLISSPDSLGENPSVDEMNALDGFYLVEGSGNLTLPDSTWNINNPDKKVVILVPGNLTINERINVGTNNNFLGFFVGGNINIDPDVTDVGVNPALEGIFFADGVFSTGGSANVLTGQGMFIAGSFDFDRDLGASNPDDPAEAFIYRPDLWINSPKELWQLDFTWQELAP